MKLYLKALLATVFVGLIFAGLFWKWRENSSRSEGETKVRTIDNWEQNGIPNFTGKKLDGSDLELKSFSNKTVIVSFWASWCGPCLEEFPSMIELIEKTSGRVELVAVSQDSAKEEIEAFLKAFPKSKHPNIHILWDQDRSIGKMYNADRLPESYVTGKELKLVRKVTGSINWATPQAIEFISKIE